MVSKLIKNIRRDPALTLLCLLAFSLPFDHVPSFPVYGLTVKLSALASVALVLFSLKKLQPSKLIGQKSVYFLALWLIWVILGLALTTNLKYAIKVVVPLTVFVLMAISVSVLWKEKYQKPVVTWLIIGAITACLFGIYQFIGNRLGVPNSLTGIRIEYSWERFGFPRMQSVALEPLYFSAYLLLPISLLGSLFLKDSAHRKISLVGILGLFLVALVHLNVYFRNKNYRTDPKLNVFIYVLMSRLS